MKKLIIDSPPNPNEAIYRNNPLAFNRVMHDWMNKTKGKIEQASQQNDSPLTQNFVLGSYTVTTALDGTSSGTDVANFLCTLVQAFIDKGMITISTATS